MLCIAILYISNQIVITFQIGWISSKLFQSLDEQSVVEAVDAHWSQTKKVAIAEPQIVLGPEIVGLIVPMSSLDEITSRSIMHSYDERLSTGTTSNLYCLLFRRYSVDNLATVVWMFGRQLTGESLEHWPPLYVLCRTYSAANMKDIMVHLFKHNSNGFNPITNTLPMNLLHLLCCDYRGDHFIDIVDLLIERGIDLKATISGKSNALHILCAHYCGQNLKPLVEHLIQCGIDPAAETESGTTAFHALCNSYRGADLKQVMELFVNNSVSATSIFLYLCLKYTGDDLVELLQLIIEQIHQTDEDGLNALHYSCAFHTGRHLRTLVQFLLTNGVDVNALTKQDFTALHYLCFKYSGSDLKEIIEIFVENGAEIGRLIRGADALFLVLIHNYNRPNLPEIVKLFYDMNHGALQYIPRALQSVCFLYRGPGLLDIVKRIVECAPTLNQYDPSQLLEDMQAAYNCVKCTNQDLSDRKEVKRYLKALIASQIGGRAIEAAQSRPGIG